MSRGLVAGCVMLVVFLLACEDDPTEPMAPEERLPVPSKVVEQRPTRLLDVSVEPEGEFRPNAQLRVRVRVRAVRDAGTVRIRAVFPEIEAAQASEWGEGFLFDPPTGLSSGFHAERTLARGTDAVFEIVSPRVESPGVYSLVVSASTEEEPDDLAGRLQTVTHKTLWFRVDEIGGRVDRRFSALPIPPEYLQMAGPFRQRGTVLGDGLGSGGAFREAGGGLDGVLAASTLPDAHLWVFYFDADKSKNRPLPGATVNLSYYQQTLNGSELVGSSSQTLDVNGRYWVDCSIDTSSPVVVKGYVDFWDSRARISSHSPVPFDHGDLEDLCLTAGHGYEEFYDVKINNAEVSRVWENFYHSISGSRSALGVSRNSIEIIVRDWEVGTCNYSSSPDDIEMYFDCIWGSFGMFTAAHEYGHAVHEKALGGNPGGGCPDPHRLKFKSNITCAYSEGFADFHAAAADGARIGSEFPTSTLRLSEVEDGSWIGEGGPETEGAVATFYYDIMDDSGAADGISGDDDGAAYGGNYVARTVANCSHYYEESFTEDQDGVIQDLLWRPNDVRGVYHCFLRDPANINPTPIKTVLDTQDNPTTVYLVNMFGLGTTPSGWDPLVVEATFNASM